MARVIGGLLARSGREGRVEGQIRDRVAAGQTRDKQRQKKFMRRSDGTVRTPALGLGSLALERTIRSCPS